ELSVDGPFASADIPLDERNLAWRGAAACLAIAKSVGRHDAGVELVVTKNVPSQAGLGGGSSDAAAAMKATELAFGLALDNAGACAELAKLGSDCVFFRAAAASGHARATGRGERIEVLEPAPQLLGIVIVTPAFGAPTAAVYRALTLPLRGGEPPRSLTPALRALDDSLGPLQPFNRLEEPALRAVPELQAWRTLLDRVAPGRFVLSGSGSSFFALCPVVGEATALCELVRAAATAASLPFRGLWATRPFDPLNRRPAPRANPPSNLA
ncbi:MAG: hypothetical protein NTV21_08055, partial [Planctomycetota bacterium]|nr:hypothetical protein [Planctomycetota bacterium]